MLKEKITISYYFREPKNLKPVRVSINRPLYSSQTAAKPERNRIITMHVSEVCLSSLSFSKNQIWAREVGRFFGWLIEKIVWGPNRKWPDLSFLSSSAYNIWAFMKSSLDLMNCFPTMIGGFKISGLYVDIYQTLLLNQTVLVLLKVRHWWKWVAVKPHNALELLKIYNKNADSNVATFRALREDCAAHNRPKTTIIGADRSVRYLWMERFNSNRRETDRILQSSWRIHLVSSSPSY